MAIWINDNKKKTVRKYCTTPAIEKAIETLLSEMEEMISSETKKGYTIKIIKENDDED